MLVVHHKKTLLEGGAPFDLANLETLCNACHATVHADDCRAGLVDKRKRLAWRMRMAQM